jgi:pyrroloquinoline quinone biosynthesis protein B
MKVLVLGSGADGGFPQWNCNCRLCAGQRSGRVRASERTQCSVAVSGDGENWVLLNVSPDIAQQIRARPALQPRHGVRDTPIGAVVLLDAHIDHVIGLLSLRQGEAIELYATPSAFEDLTAGLPILPALQHYCGIHWHMVPVAGEQSSAAFGIEGIASLRFEAIAIAGRTPPYSLRRNDPAVGDSIALRISDTRSGKRLFYAPLLASAGDDEIEWMQDCDCVLVDGTFWSQDEMITAGLGSRQAHETGHLPQTAGRAGAPGMMEALARLPASRKVLVHINNSNPILDELSGERRELERQGIEVAYDGMEIVL